MLSPSMLTQIVTPKVTDSNSRLHPAIATGLAFLPQLRQHYSGAFREQHHLRKLSASTDGAGYARNFTAVVGGYLVCQLPRC